LAARFCAVCSLRSAVTQIDVTFSGLESTLLLVKTSAGGSNSSHRHGNNLEYAEVIKILEEAPVQPAEMKKGWQRKAGKKAGREGWEERGW
jgi:hypothetical protein